MKIRNPGNCAIEAEIIAARSQVFREKRKEIVAGHVRSANEPSFRRRLPSLFNLSVQKQDTAFRVGADLKWSRMNETWGIG
jgi:hypothetical protein